MAVAVAVREAGAAGAVQAQPQHHVEDNRRARHRHHRRVLHESSVTDRLFGDLDIRNRPTILNSSVADVYRRLLYFSVVEPEPEP